MEKIDTLINKYAPIDLATGNPPDNVMAIDLRNIRHHAFSILCELITLQRQYESLKNEMMIIVDFEKMGEHIKDIAKYFARDHEAKK